jgi:opacity protein-like surface antigen
MVQMTAPDRLHSLRRICVARGFLGSLLALSFLAVDADPIGADETDGDPSATRPDFRFKPPWVTLGLRGGWAFNRSDSEIHDFLNETLTLNDADFDGPAFALDVAVRATSWLDVVVGFEVTGRKSKSEFRNFVEASGASIEQKTTLTQVPLTASLKLYPIGRGRQVGEYAWVRSTLVPYLGGGIGATYYKLKQKGDFVDFVDLTIFEAKLESDGWAFAQHAFAGLDLKLTRNFGLVLEGRYYWADADLSGNFVGFGKIDLDGARVMAGFSWRL